MKTVFVLGAGFSRPAGLPLQNDILRCIRDFKVDLLQSPAHTLDVFEPARDRVTEFLERVFPDTADPPLEDVFTLLDETIAHRDSFAGYSWIALDQVRDALKRAILFVLHQATQEMADSAKDLYMRIAAHLLLERVAAGQSGDPFSVLSLNWDYVLDDLVYRCLHLVDGSDKGDVDYCCYTTPLSAGATHVPSLQQKALGLFNVKILKLHGSANWLRCPSCNRLFTGVGGGGGVWEQYVLEQRCRYCEKTTGVDESASSIMPPILEPFLVTPTFVKVLNDNPHIQMIWHNAFMDLAESSTVVFIGYSLPEADYHVRTLLRRAISPEAELHTVLIDSDRIPDDAPAAIQKMYAANRYKAFFGTRVQARFDGVEGYFEDIMAHAALGEMLEQIADKM